MTGFWTGLLLGAMVAVGALAIARMARTWADDRARERRYADEWVARHREGRRP